MTNFTSEQKIRIEKKVHAHDVATGYTSYFGVIRLQLVMHNIAYKNINTLFRNKRFILYYVI